MKSNNSMAVHSASATACLEAQPEPTDCRYAPPGEYIKDHCFLFADNVWHLFAIHGQEGAGHGYTGNEESFVWSTTHDLVHWQTMGSILHASAWPECFDRDEVWAPFCLSHEGRVYMFYTGVVQPYRVRGDRRHLEHVIPRTAKAARLERIGLAVSDRLSRWEKCCDFASGLGIEGRDPHVVWDEDGRRWLMYTTGTRKRGTMSLAHVSVSNDLYHWTYHGECAALPPPDPGRSYTTTESLTVMRHPLTGRWIMLGNWHYCVSADPLDFHAADVCCYDQSYDGREYKLGFAGEMLCHKGTWYRSGACGAVGYWKLGLTEVEWVVDGAFRIRRPGIMADWLD